MYSPKIDELIVPKLYLIAKSRGVFMTELVNQILKKFVKKQSKEV